MTFFTPITNFRMRKYTGEGVAFKPGQIYHKTFLGAFDFQYVVRDKNNLDLKIAYLCTQWIKVVEPTDIYELVKSLLLTQKGE